MNSTQTQPETQTGGMNQAKLPDEIFRYNAKKDKFIVNRLNENDYSGKQLNVARRINAAIDLVVQEARTSLNTQNQYLTKKNFLLNNLKISDGKKDALLKSYDNFYKEFVVKPFDIRQVPGYSPVSLTSGPVSADNFFDPVFYLEKYPEVKAEYERAVEEGNLDILGTFPDINTFAAGDYQFNGATQNREPNAFASKGKFVGDNPLGFEGGPAVTQQTINLFRADKKDELAEDSVTTALGEEGLLQTKQFGRLSEDVLRTTINRLERAKREEQQFDITNNLLGSQFSNFGSNAANDLLGDAGGLLPTGVRDEISKTLGGALGQFGGNSTIVNWQNFFEKDLIEKYAKDYEKKFADLELEKDILENAQPKPEDYIAYVESNPKVLEAYEEVVSKTNNQGFFGSSANANGRQVSKADFGRAFYAKNGSKKEFRSQALEKKGEVFDKDSGEFTREFLRETGFEKTDDLVEYLKELPGGRDILFTISGREFVPGGKKIDKFDRIKKIDNEIKAIDNPNNPDFNYKDIDSQFARDFINDYLRPRFNASKSINEFINFIDVDEELQTPFQTQSTKNALQVLALDQTKTFLDALKPVDGLDANFDARFFENPFFDRPVKEQVAADSSRYERKLEFQKNFFKEQFERAKSGDPKYLNALLVRGIVPQPFEDNKGNLIYDIQKEPFARTLYDITRGGRDIDGNEILLDGAPITFAAFDNPIDPDRIERYKNFELIPSLLDERDVLGGGVFGNFISPDEFAEGVLDNAGVGPNTKIGRQLGLVGGEGELDEVKNILISTIQGQDAATLRERIKALAEAGEEISQETLGVDYIEREIDKESGREGAGLFGIFQQAGFKGTENEFYDTFFPGQSKEEVKAEFGDFDILGGLNTSSPEAALSSIGSFLDTPSIQSPNSFADFGNNTTIKTKKSTSGQNFLDDFTSDFGGDLLGGGGGGFGGLPGFGF